MCLQLSVTILGPAPPNQRRLPEEEPKVYSIKVMLPSPNKETRPLPRNIVKPQTSKSKIHTHKQRRLCLKFQASSFSANLLISCKEKKRMEKHISICSEHPSAVSWLTSGFCTFSAFSLPAALSPPRNACASWVGAPGSLQDHTPPRLWAQSSLPPSPSPAPCQSQIDHCLQFPEGAGLLPTLE